MLIEPGAGSPIDCDRFVELWNQLLDDRKGHAPDRERWLEAHAADCPPCRATAARYQALRQAIAAIGSPPAPSAEETARLLTVLAAGRVPSQGWSRARLAWIPLATAAALFALARLGGTDRSTPRPSIPAPTPVVAARPLVSALSDARSASIALAVEASAPAARIGRDLLEGSDDTKPGADPAAETLAASDHLLKAVGERVNAGVRPLSGSARHAFSFLLGPPEAGNHPSPPAASDSL